MIFNTLGESWFLFVSSAFLTNVFLLFCLWYWLRKRNRPETVIKVDSSDSIITLLRAKQKCRECSDTVSSDKDSRRFSMIVHGVSKTTGTGTSSALAREVTDNTSKEIVSQMLEQTQSETFLKQSGPVVSRSEVTLKDINLETIVDDNPDKNNSKNEIKQQSKQILHTPSFEAVVLSTVTSLEKIKSKIAVTSSKSLGSKTSKAESSQQTIVKVNEFHKISRRDSKLSKKSKDSKGSNSTVLHSIKSKQHSSKTSQALSTDSKIGTKLKTPTMRPSIRPEERSLTHKIALSRISADGLGRIKGQSRVPKSSEITETLRKISSINQASKPPLPPRLNRKPDHPLSYAQREKRSSSLFSEMGSSDRRKSGEVRSRPSLVSSSSDMRTPHKKVAFQSSIKSGSSVSSKRSELYYPRIDKFMPPTARLSQYVPPYLAVSLDLPRKKSRNSETSINSSSHQQKAKDDGASQRKAQTLKSIIKKRKQDPFLNVPKVPRSNEGSRESSISKDDGARAGICSNSIIAHASSSSQTGVKVRGRKRVDIDLDWENI